METTSQMLSVSFDTEISSFFWGLLGKSTNVSVADVPSFVQAESSVQLLPVISDSSSPEFLQFFVFPVAAEGSIYSSIQYSVKTAGVLAMAGMFSYCAYSALTTFRSKLIEKELLKSSSQKPGMELILRTESACSIASVSRISRPDSLQLSSKSSAGNYLRTLAKSVFSHNGSVIRVLSGEEGQDEDVEYEYDELESDYFGPLGGELSEDENEDGLEDNYFLFPPVAAPISPTDSAYTSEYLRRGGKSKNLVSS